MYKFILATLLLWSPSLFADILPTHQTERDFAEGFIKANRISSDDTLVFFTTAFIPEKYTFLDGEAIEPRKSAELCLSFAVNSLANYKAFGNIVKPKLVPGSKTLWYVDADDFNWSRKDLQAIFKLQPYFLSPVVEGANVGFIFRADWILVNALDTTKQEDRGLKTIVYDTLLYGLNNAPKTKREFRERWGSFAKNAQTAVIVDTGDSGVSRHARELLRVGTEFGYLWDTRDVKSLDLDPVTVRRRDVFENLPNKRQVDATETIASNNRGLQVYHLTAGTNDQFKPINFADPTIVIDRVDHTDVRVRMVAGCVRCHAGGIVPYSSLVQDFFRENGKILTDDRNFQRELRAVYLKYNNEEVESDNKLFAAAVKKTNGLDPFASAKTFTEIYRWYWDEKVTPKQAALELGLTIPELNGLIKTATNLLDRKETQTYGRITLLGKGKAMPRETWDSTLDGGYLQLALELKGLGQVEASYMDYDQAFRAAKSSSRGLLVVKGLSKSDCALEAAKAEFENLVFAVAIPDDDRVPNGVHRIPFKR